MKKVLKFILIFIAILIVVLIASRILFSINNHSSASDVGKVSTEEKPKELIAENKDGAASPQSKAQVISEIPETVEIKKETTLTRNKNPIKESLVCLEYSAKINDNIEDDYYMEQRKKGIYTSFAIILGPNRIKIVKFNPLTILYESIAATNINYDWEDTVSYEMDKSLGSILIGRSPWTRKLDSEMQKYGVPSSGEYRMKIIPSKDPRHLYFYCN